MPGLFGDRHTSLLREMRISPWRTVSQWRHRGAITVGRGFILKGGDRITLADGARLALGTAHHGLVDHRTGGVIRVHGSLSIDGYVTVYSGNAWEVAEGARMSIGADTYFSPSGSVLCADEIRIGSGCAIGHYTQLMDTDLHPIGAEGEEPQPFTAPITLGDRVLVGSRCSILKGVPLADGCVVAAGSVVTRSEHTPGSLLAGAPARVVRTGVTWA